MNAKSNQGWLQFAAEREYYFAPRGLPKMFPEDYMNDYLPLQGGIASLCSRTE